MLIYICHEYGGKRKNVQRVEKIIRELMEKFPNHTFMSPHHAFGYAYHDVDYDQGMRYCLELLERCDAMWTFGERSKSKGCMIEVEFCRENKILVLNMG